MLPGRHACSFLARVATLISTARNISLPSPVALVQLLGVIGRSGELLLPTLLATFDPGDDVRLGEEGAVHRQTPSVQGEGGVLRSDLEWADSAVSTQCHTKY